MASMENVADPSIAAIEALGYSCQDIEECPAVLVVQVDVIAGVAAGGDVAEGAGELQTKSASHGCSIAQKTDISRPDPYPLQFRFDYGKGLCVAPAKVVAVALTEMQRLHAGCLARGGRSTSSEDKENERTKNQPQYSPESIAHISPFAV